MKQTAVEYLMDKLLINDCLSVPKDFWYEYLKVIEQANKMFEEQISEAFINGEVSRDRIDADEYYKETYGGNK
jgi:hypothetical protein